ncbi:hypothetical protein ACFUTV_43765 [Streptomyces sp. NPDC057298]|uniref:hypothetical protein n=1 Tax=Streptomyces sp. NPDC057298 TaxID=3346091 RepID=UPI00363003BA
MTGLPNPGSGGLSVLLLGDGFEPGGAVAGAVADDHGDVGHEGVAGGAVPVGAGTRRGQREGALARRAAWQMERQDARAELRAQVWLSADVSRRLRTIAARTGFEPEQVLAQLADRVRMDDDGSLTVDAFTPR